MCGIITGIMWEHTGLREPISVTVLHIEKQKNGVNYPTFGAHLSRSASMSVENYFSQIVIASRCKKERYVEASLLYQVATLLNCFSFSNVHSTMLRCLNR